MEFLLTLLSSSGFGAITGGIFGWLSKREERENMKIRYQHQVELIKAKSDAAIKTAELNNQTQQVLAKVEVEKEETKAFTASQATSSNIAEILKSIIRPAILAVLLYQSHAIFQALEKLSGGIQNLPVQDITDLYRIMILSITGLTSVAVGWYFAQRTSKQFDKLLDLHNRKDV
jgi:hypothetical protein